MKKFKIIFTILIISLLCACSNSNNQAANQEKKVVEEKVFYSSLDGKEVKEEDLDRPIFAIMFDNHPGARPQSSIEDAEIIYEYKVEGEYTRFLGIFQRNEASVIGPIRSARPYFVNTAKEYNAIYVHWGGSEAGYEQIKIDGVNDIDGIAYEGSTFYRNKEVNKKRPHDGYSSYDLLLDRAKELSYLDDIKNDEYFKFDTSKDLADLKGQMQDTPCDDLKINFFPSYNTDFVYDKEKGMYLVVVNGENLIDEASNNDIFASNIIIQFANSKVAGPNGTLKIDNIGQGSGKLISDGKIIDIKWEKADENSKTKFYTLDDKEIILKPGKTFIETTDAEEDLEILPLSIDEKEE